MAGPTGGRALSVHATPIPGAGTERARGPHRSSNVSLAAFAGVVFFIVIVANARLRTNVPAADDPGREVLSFVAAAGTVTGGVSRERSRSASQISAQALRASPGRCS